MTNHRLNTRHRTCSMGWMKLAGVATAATSIALVSSLGASPAMAGNEQSPFRASLSGTITQAAPCPLGAICGTAIDHGQATHLGETTLTKSFTVYLTSQSCQNGGRYSTFTETGTLEGANGDALDFRGDGTACTINGHAFASGVLQVTRGTGRFSEATGTLNETIDHDIANHTETADMTGSVSAPGAND